MNNCTTCGGNIKGRRKPGRPLGPRGKAKTVAFSLYPDAMAILEELAEGVTKSSVVDRLLREAKP